MSDSTVRLQQTWLALFPGAIAILFAIAPLQAQPAKQSIEQLVAEIETLRAQTSAADRTATERHAAIERALEMRRNLIAANPGDCRLPIWLADQAADLFFIALPMDGMGLTALFGVPSPQTLQDVRATVVEMHAAAQRAEETVDPAMRKLEAMPRFADDPALQESRRQLAEVERDRRIPFLRGVSAYLHGELNVVDADQRQKQFALARQLLIPLTESLEGVAAIEARLYAGLAHAQLGEFEPAEALFANVARDDSASAAQTFAARMGGVMNRTVRGGPQSGLDALTSIEQRYATAGENASADTFYRVIIADHRFRLRRDLAEAAPQQQRAAMMAQAIAAYTDLLKTETGIPRETMRAIVFSRLASAVDEQAPLEQLPAIVTIARAEQLSQEQSTRERAIAMLESALSVGKMDPFEHGSALYVLGRAMYAQGQSLFASQRLIELAAAHPAHDQSQRAIELGVAIASELHRESPDDDEALAALRQGLDILLEKYPNLPTIDRWRYAAARLALKEGRLQRAEELFGEITPDAAEWYDAQFMQAATQRAHAAATAVDAAQKKKANEELLDVIARVQPIIEGGLASTVLNESRAKALRYYIASLRVFRAQAALDLNQPQQAIDILKGVEAGDALDAGVLGEAMKVRVNAYQSMSQPEQAIGEIEQYVHAAPEQAGEALAPLLSAMQRDVQALIDISRDDRALDLANRTLLPVAGLLDQWLTASEREPALQRDFGGRVADAYRLSGEYELALDWYERLLRTDPNSAELLLGQAECWYHLGGEQWLAGAMGIYKRLAAPGPDAGSGSDLYWLSQLRMLQVIDRVNRNTEQILPRIEKLRQQDRDLGGERFRRGFEALRNKHAPN